MVRFLENNTLCFHRSWTGKCIYQVHFILENAFYMGSEVWVNRDVNLYKETDDNYDKKLLLFLIENLLLENNTPFPIPSSIPKDYARGALQHSIAGTGNPEIEVFSED